MDATIDWLGHATLLIEMDGVRIMTDPTIRERIGPLDRKVPPVTRHALDGIDAVLVSHLHLDHLDLASIRRLGQPRLIVPAGSGGIFRAVGHHDIDEVAPGDTTRHGPLTIDVVRADHSGFRPPFGPTGPALGFIVSNGRRRVYFAGDTALYPEMADLGELDAAFLPVWGWGPNLRGGHMDPVMAAHAADLIRPELAVPVHWGTYWPKAMGKVRPDRFVGPGSEFAVAAGELAAGVRVVVLSPGEQVALGGRPPGR